VRVRRLGCERFVREGLGHDGAELIEQAHGIDIWAVAWRGLKKT